MKTSTLLKRIAKFRLLIIKLEYELFFFCRENEMHNYLIDLTKIYYLFLIFLKLMHTYLDILH